MTELLVVENGSNHQSALNLVENGDRNGIVHKADPISKSLENANDSKMDLDDEDEKSILSLVKPSALQKSMPPKPSTSNHNHQDSPKRSMYANI